ILVVALVIVPAATAYLLSRRLVTMIALSAVIAVGGALGGFFVAYALNAATSAGMAVFYGALFVIAVIGVRLTRKIRQRQLSDKISQPEIGATQTASVAT